MSEENALRNGRETFAGGKEAGEPILSVLGCLSGEPITARQIEEELYGEEILGPRPNGKGDYTKEREQWLGEVSINHVIKEIRQGED